MACFTVVLIDNKAARREQTCSGSSGSSRARPGDIFHPDFADGRPSFFEVTVRNTAQAEYVCKAAGTAAMAGEMEL